MIAAAALAAIGRGRCPHCGHDVALTSTGALRRHGPLDADAVLEPRFTTGRSCPGGGRPPAPS